MPSSTPEPYFFPSKEDPRFEITLEIGKYHVDFRVEEIVYIPEFLEDGTVSWGRDRENNPLPRTEDATELYVRGFIKWDGCAHFYFGEENTPGYLHLCSPLDIKAHADLMLHLHATALERMGDIALGVSGNEEQMDDMMRHARAPRPKRRGLRTMMIIFIAMLSAVVAAWAVSMLALYYVVGHGGS